MGDTGTAMRQRMREIREQLATVQGWQCGVPSCTERWVHPAHIDGSGSGGRLSTYTLSNIVGLCRLHHDQFDGRSLQGRQHLLRELMQYVVVHERQAREAMQL